MKKPIPVPKESEQKKEKLPDNNAAMEIYDWLQCIVSAFICALLIFTFIGRLSVIDGDSMRDTLHNKDVVVLSNLFYTPQYGDIVIIETDAIDEPIVKRVIATEGQIIDINFDTGEVMVDGSIILEDYILEPTMSSYGFDGPETVPDGCVFVMGDNRNGSRDSRDATVGMIDTREVLGKVLFLIVPGSDEDSPRDWNRFGSVYG